MQDPLEDYLKLTNPSRKDDPVKISKEMVVTAHLKKECDSRAMKIVEFSIEGKLRPEVFTKCLPFINQGHYQDIVEERAITKLCGYSVCGKRIPDMPKKQYLISTKSNKVYDITERKNFCSNFCYKASLHIKKQIDNTPLWLRKLEDIPEYKLLHSSEGGLPGDYIDQGMVKPVKDEFSFTSVNSFAQASLGDISERKTDSGKNNKTRGFKKSSRLKSTMQTIKENDTEEAETINETNKPTKRGMKIIKKETHKKSCIVSLPSIEENEERLGQNSKENDCGKELNVIIKEESIKLEEEFQKVTIPKTVEEKVMQIKTEPPEKRAMKKMKSSKAPDVEGLVKKAVDEWVTLETCIFIHGEQRVKEVLSEKKLSDYFDTLHVQELHREQQIKYMEICRRLQLQEMADDRFDRAIVGGNKLKPIPDYRKLKEDMKEMKLKVKSFYTGTMYEETDKNFPSQINNKEADDNPEEGPPAVLPPVDVNSQKLLRRKIFLGSLSKAIQQLLKALGAPYSAVLSDVQALVRTFNLKADNITFKPAVWTYIALLLLDLLSLKDSELKAVLEDKRSEDYIRMLFEALPSKENFVPELLSNVKDIELFVERYITREEDNRQ